MHREWGYGISSIWSEARIGFGSAENLGKAFRAEEVEAQVNCLQPCGERWVARDLCMKQMEVFAERLGQVDSLEAL